MCTSMQGTSKHTQALPGLTLVDVHRSLKGVWTVAERGAIHVFVVIVDLNYVLFWTLDKIQENLD